MKVKTSIIITKSVLKEIDATVSRWGNRSLFIEEAVIHYLNRRKRAEKGKRDLDIINRAACELNREADDSLTYKADN